MDKNRLDRLITNIKLYHKDETFISEYIDEYSEECNSFLPSSEGIIFIDMVSDIILDSQDITGINKVTPTEIKRSKNGNIPDETMDNSVVNRFIKLFDAGYLVGFNEWRDNGNHLNKTILELDINELISHIMVSNYQYGEFVFSTKPYKVETYNVIYWEDQLKLFNRAKELELIPIEKYNLWQQHIEDLK